MRRRIIIGESLRDCQSYVQRMAFNPRNCVLFYGTPDDMVKLKGLDIRADDVTVLSDAKMRYSFWQELNIRISIKGEAELKQQKK